jgi:peptidase M1-like protein
LRCLPKTCAAGMLVLAITFWLPCDAPGEAGSGEKLGPDALLKALEEIRFDLKHVYRVRDLSVRRDAITLNFDRGRVIFLEPVNGVVTGLLFWGRGTVVAVPPRKTEKQQLNLFTGSPTLSERFGEAFLRFTDETHAELIAQISASPEEEPIDESAGLTEFQQLLRREVLSNYRVLADLLNGGKTPMFSGKLGGSRLGLIDLAYDQRKAEDIHIGQFHAEHEPAIYDSWCSYSSSSKESEIARGSFAWKLIDVRHYRIDTEIDRNDRLSATTEAEFVCEQNDEWMLTFDLSRLLKVSRIEDELGRSLRFFQNNEMTKDEEIGRLGHDVVVVMLPEPMRRGSVKRLRFTYSGEVISRVGSGMFYVGSRGSWYPNLGTSDRARYTLSFKHPKPLTIVSIGSMMKSWEEDDRRCSLWKTEEEVPVAGFNYGDYNRTVATGRGIQVEVYANKGIENMYQEVISRMEYVRAMQRQQALNPRNRRAVIPAGDPFPAMPNFLDFDTTRFAKEISAQVINTLDFFEGYLGHYPYRKLAVSQIPGRFSQGWPSLLYASSLSFLSPSQRARLGLEGDREAFYLECLHAHEIAHQWWGNLLSWKSYHDLWMFEGFSTYLGYLSLHAKYPEGRQFADLLRYGREKLLDKNSDGQTLESAGPIWLGARLSSSRFPNGYGTLVYEKGAWILHMLRYLFSDPVSGSDDRFKLLLRDFVSSHAGGLVETADFQKIVNKHMSRELDLEGNRKLDWFFDQWVYETGIPTYRLDSSLTATKSGGFVLKGRIKQDHVSEYFMMPVEVFGHFSPNKVVRIGRVVAAGKETDFRLNLKTKPQKVTLDENHQILCQNETL